MVGALQTDTDDTFGFLPLRFALLASPVSNDNLRMSSKALSVSSTVTSSPLDKVQQIVSMSLSCFNDAMEKEDARSLLATRARVHVGDDGAESSSGALYSRDAER